MVAEAALHVFDIRVAKRIYRQILHDAGMVITLDALQNCEDRLLLGGHMSMIFGDFDTAQDLFLQSSEPTAALDMRRDLMQWEQSLSLAAKLSPMDVTVIAREYASRLESDGKTTDALTMYEKALETSNNHPGTDMARESHQIMCSAGITRMTIKMGDVTRGMKMLHNVDDSKLLNDCAAILETIKMYLESGTLYERAKAWEKAADVYIKGKISRESQIFFI
jgi:WD repeat-containing protein 19